MWRLLKQFRLSILGLILVGFYSNAEAQVYYWTSASPIWHKFPSRLFPEDFTKLSPYTPKEKRADLDSNKFYILNEDHRIHKEVIWTDSIMGSAENDCLYNPLNALRFAQKLTQAFIRIDSSSQSYYVNQLATFEQFFFLSYDSMEKWLDEELGQDRKIITDSKALGYWAESFDFEVIMVDSSTFHLRQLEDEVGTGKIYVQHVTKDYEKTSLGQAITAHGGFELVPVVYVFGRTSTLRTSRTSYLTWFEKTNLFMKGKITKYAKVARKIDDTKEPKTAWFYMGILGLVTGMLLYFTIRKLSKK